MKTNWMVVSLMAGLAFAPACKKQGAAGAEAKGAEPAGEAEPAPAKVALKAKLHAAIGCLNDNSGEVLKDRRKYLDSLADPEKGPQPKDYVWPFVMVNFDGCKRDVEKAAALTPAVPDLDKASAEYVAALIALAPPVEAMGSYYKTAENKVDGGKKAPELHAALVAGWARFVAANDALDGLVGTMNRAIRVDEVAAQEKAEGRNLAVLLDLVLLEAETVVDELHKEKVDLAAFDAHTEAYGKLLAEMDAYMAAHPDEPAKNGSMGNIKNYSKQMLGAARTVSLKLHANTPPTDEERRKVGEQFNDLVDNYNR
jgi:hypothetical protein